MSLVDDLREVLERQERDTVGTAFGGAAGTSTTSYSVARVRDSLASRVPSAPDGALEEALVRMKRQLLPETFFRAALASLLRFAFLIELTNLKVGSTKMKTRWLPGLIQMPQPGSFEPVAGSFEPGNDPRSASFADCLAVFTQAATILCDQIQSNASLAPKLLALNRFRRVPYEFPVGYLDPQSAFLHRASNITWSFNADTNWLLKARPILKPPPPAVASAMTKIVKAKLEVKVFKTDRALTGKDKTNRAKRWEVLPGDFQHATLPECWSVERQLTHDLVCFKGFPNELRQRFVEAGLVSPDAATTRCPVTLEVLDFAHLAASVLDPTHGVSQYQIGHLHPLKRQGKHNGDNVRWQSADGNRIQGDRSLEETAVLLEQIHQRRVASQS